MPCFHPLHGYKTKSGKWVSAKSVNNPVGLESLSVPCQQCCGCRLEYSRQWALRIHHEASLYLHNSFITLTYNNAHLPKITTDGQPCLHPKGTLRKRDFQLFMKRLRENINDSDTPHKIKFYHCGEYGDEFGRPHYHACLFNHHFDDKKLIPGKSNLYYSKSLQDAWSIKKQPIGMVSVGDLTFESAAYTAGYLQKKINGKQKKHHYSLFAPDGSEISHREPEYATMSRGGRKGKGIGYDWFKKYYTDAYPSDFITHKGKKMKPPKYYDSQYEKLFPDEMEEIKEKRQQDMEKISYLFTPEALQQKELTHKAKMSIYKRNKL